MSTIPDQVSATSSAAATVQDEGVATASAARISALDILRGIALLGMFLVHFKW